MDAFEKALAEQARAEAKKAKAPEKPAEVEVDVFEEEIKKMERDGSPAAVIQDIVVPAAQGATLNTADEIVGGIGAALEVGGGSKEKFGDLMDKHAAPMREMYAESKERSPVMSTISEIGGGIFGTKKLPGGAISQGAQGFVQGLASKDKDKLSKESLMDAGVSAGLNSGMSLISRAAKAVTGNNPNTVRAKVLGAGAKEFGEVGVKEREVIAKRLKEDGFFAGRQVVFNPKTLKYEPKSAGMFKLDQMDLPVPDRLLKRAEEGVQAIEDEKDTIWNQFGDPTISEQEVERALNDAVSEYIGKNPRYFKALDQAGALKDELIQTLKARVIGGNGVISAKGVDTLKSDLYDYTSFGKEADAMPDSDVLYQKMARKLKELVNSKVKDPRFKDLNETQGRLLTARKDLKKKINTLKGMDSKTQEIPQNAVSRLGFKILGGEDTQLGAADLRENLNKIPESLRIMGAEGVQKAPGVIFRNHENQDQEIPMMAPPQSYIPRQLKGIPEQLINTPLERTSKPLLENKRLVLAKFAQQMPEFFGMVAEAAKDDEQFVKVMGFLANAPKVPGQPSPRDLFKKDKYDTFDGMILDPKMKMLAMDDVRNNEELNSIQKAELLNKIQMGKPIA